MTDRDSITRTRARAPGAEGDPPSMAVHRPIGGPAQYGTTALTLRCTKGDGKPGVSRCMPGAGLSLWRSGKAPPDRPAFQPYWGKPAVRNERGDRGNVGIIRSPVRASILPDSRGASNLTGRSSGEPVKPRKRAPRETDCGSVGSAEPFRSRRRPCRHRVNWTHAMSELLRVREDGMSGRNGSESPEPLAGRLGAPAQRRHRV